MTVNFKPMKTIGNKHIADYGNITIKFAYRCHKYKSAGLPIKPTTLKTIRLGFFSNYGITPATVQIVSAKEVEEILILN